MSYEDKEYEELKNYDEHIKKQEKERRDKWYNSIDQKYLIIANIGGSLWDDIVEVRNYRDCEDGEYWSLDGNTNWKNDRLERNYSVVAFDNKKQAELFLKGAQFFRDFAVKLLGQIKE